MICFCNHHNLSSESLLFIFPYVTLPDMIPGSNHIAAWIFLQLWLIRSDLYGLSTYSRLKSENIFFFKDFSDTRYKFIIDCSHLSSHILFRKCSLNSTLLIFCIMIFLLGMNCYLQQRSESSSEKKKRTDDHWTIKCKHSKSFAFAAFSTISYRN